MAFSLTTRMSLDAQMTAVLGAGNENGSVNLSQTTTYGATGNADLVSAPAETLAPAATDTHILDDSSMLDLNGVAADFAKVTQIMIQNTGLTNGLVLGGTFNGIIDLEVPFGGSVLIDLGDAGVAVGVGETITVQSTGGTTYKLAVAGLAV